MKILIVTNLNGIGLQRDFELVRDILLGLGHDVSWMQYDDHPDLAGFRYDLTIFLEVVPREFLETAPVKWAFLNPEWVKPEMVRLIERNIDKVFAKTREAERIFKDLWPDRTHYTGFAARDQYSPHIPRRPWCLHIGGNSSIRGTQAVIDAWRWKKDGVGMDGHLIVVSSVLKERPEVPMVTYYDRIGDEQLKVLQNQCLFHIYPTATEGYGHAIHEALGVGAVLLVTDAPPMNEIENAIRIPATKISKYNQADLYQVSALDIHESVNAARKKHHDTKETFARHEFLRNNEEFRKNLAAHLEDVKPRHVQAHRKKGTALRVGFLGNFLTAESTESMVRWAMEERLGIEVEALQENHVTLSALEEAMDYNDIFLWIHTHGYLAVNDRAMEAFLAKLRDRGTPTISMHLDKFWGIPEREARIGVDPFWKTQFVFTADGSRDKEFKAAGVNHHWMRPAISEVYCHPGVPRDEFRCDVGFVGAKGYHTEYPFRPQLLDWLAETYGDRFKHITGVRGHALNDFYASCRVAVGDCIFSGIPRYWSDRVPETVGRHGILLHPLVEGFDVPAFMFEPQNLRSLHEQIEVALATPPAILKYIRIGAADHVKNYHTWTNRMREILEIAGGDKWGNARR